MRAVLAAVLALCVSGCFTSDECKVRDCDETETGTESETGDEE